MTASGRHLRRWRLILARSLVVLGAIFTLLAAVAGYVRYQALDTDTFRGTAQEMIANDTIRDQIGATLTDVLFTTVDVQAALDQQLPEAQKGLAGPLAFGAQALADQTVPQLLERPRVQQLWVESLVRTQKQLVRLLDNDTTAVRTEGGYLILDLNPLVIQLGDRVAVIGNIASRIPPDSGRIKIMKADDLSTAQNLAHLLDLVGLWLWVVPVLLFGAAVALARGRRRLEVRAIAISGILVGVLLLVLRGLTGRYVVNDLVQSDTVRPAVSDAWNIITSLLADGAWTILGLALVLLLGVWLTGPARSGTAARRALAPFLARPAVAYGALAVLLLLLLWWGPTAQTRRAPQVLAMVIVFAIGLEAIRRLTTREFPAAAAVPLGDVLRSPFAHLREGHARERRLSELDRLGRLHESGALSDEEFAAEKARLR